MIPKNTVILIINAVINAGNSEAIIKLQPEDFTFIDIAGDVMSGRDG
ncbi:MAG: hypothetical protein ACE5R6_03980 [Candidatus Heimdallarchaeota archaeon]